MATLSEYRIVIGAHACFNERRAAEFIRANARLVTGVLLPLVSDREPPVPCEIAVGRTNRERADGMLFARAENRLWEYEIRLAGERLYLAGLGLEPAEKKPFSSYAYYNDGAYGTVFAAYRFVEEVLGYRFLFSPYTGIPVRRAEDIVIDRTAEFAYTTERLDAELPPVVPGAALYSVPCAWALNWNMTAMILKTASGKLAVIDGGRIWDADHMVRILEHLSGGKKPVIGAWFFSHLHNDHYGLVEKLATDEALRSRVTVEHIYAHPLEREFYTDLAKDKETRAGEVLDMLHRAGEIFGAEYHTVETGDVIPFEEFEFHVLHVPEPVPVGYMDINDSSVVYKMIWEGKESVLLLGDAERVCDADLLENHAAELESDLVQVGHHGCGNVSRECYEKTKGKAFLFQTGERFWYGDNGEGLNTLNAGVIRTRLYLKEMGVPDERILRDTDGILTFRFPMGWKKVSQNP